MAGVFDHITGTASPKRSSHQIGWGLLLMAVPAAQGGIGKVTLMTRLGLPTGGATEADLDALIVASGNNNAARTEYATLAQAYLEMFAAGFATEAECRNKLGI